MWPNKTALHSIDQVKDPHKKQTTVRKGEKRKSENMFVIKKFLKCFDIADNKSL